MLAHLTEALDWTWATAVLGALGVVAVGAVWWSWRAMRRPPERRPGGVVLIGGPVIAVGIAAGALATIDHWDWLVADGSIRSDGVVAPAVDVAVGTERFRIGDGSTVTYRVEERLGGSRSTAVGTTDLVAGEIALDRQQPSASRLGTIVVNVEAFTSDSTLRDRRIRHDYLASTEFPYATFEPTAIVGLPDDPFPDDLQDGEPVTVTITGELTVKETTATETFRGWVALDGDVLTATMSTTVRMSTYDVGPISISGLVATDDEVELTFAVVARPAADGEASDLEPADLADAIPNTADTNTADTNTDGSTPADTNTDDTNTDDTNTDEPGAGTQSGGVSFVSTVAPILEQRCASCHTAGGVGAATVTIDTAREAAVLADDIGLVVEAGYMPPWPAGPLSVDFEHDWSLTDRQRADLLAWIDARAPLDVSPDTALEPDGQLVRTVDADIEARGEPYTGALDQIDDYRCQVFEMGEADEPRWITSFHLQPDQDEIVHHAVYFRAPASARELADSLDRRDEQPGWACFGLAGITSADQIGAWAPGAQPKDFPGATGIRFDPGDFLIVQIHYHYDHHDDHDTPADASTVLVDFASPTEVAAAGGEFASVDYVTYLAPAEIPCADGEDGPLCDRDVVIDQLRDEFGPFAAAIPDGLIALCRADLAALLADTDGTAHAECLHRISNPGEIVGVFGHMHEFGAAYRMTLNPGTPEERILLDIPNWSFDWQLDFRPVESIVVTSDDVIKVECTWDRSLAPMPEPRHITWNEGTEDEMCYSVLATVP